MKIKNEIASYDVLEKVKLDNASFFISSIGNNKFAESFIIPDLNYLRVCDKFNNRQVVVGKELIGIIDSKGMFIGDNKYLIISYNVKDEINIVELEDVCFEALCSMYNFLRLRKINGETYDHIQLKPDFSQKELRKGFGAIKIFIKGEWISYIQKDKEIFDENYNKIGDIVFMFNREELINFLNRI